MLMNTRKIQPGFTIVELVLVIVVIAVLATIIVVAYNGVVTRANNSKIAAELNGIRKIVELYAVDNGAYPASNNPSVLSDLGSQLEKSGVRSPYDNMQATGRIGTSPLCDSEPNYYGNNTYCAGYTYYYLTQGQSIGNTGQYGSGCNITAPSGDGVVIEWYDKSSNMVKFRTNQPANLAIAVMGTSQVYPNQQCVFSQ
jgi:prepilin-type N-terminal cleavage/methylation domain-containing protein